VIEESERIAAEKVGAVLDLNGSKFGEQSSGEKPNGQMVQ
jgi:hypothetical protein